MTAVGNRRSLGAICCGALLLLLASIAQADSIWDVTTGDWNTAGNWSPSGVPTSSTNVRIGTTGTNRTVNITSADAASARSYIAYNPSNIVAVNVLNGKTWTVGGELDAGYYGTGTLNIQNGSTVSDISAFVGCNYGSTGTVKVDGAGSQWKNNTAIYVGSSYGVTAPGSGTLNIQNGGTVSDTNGFIYESGTVTVNGTGSQWNHNAGSLYVGDSGSGTLNIQNSGKVSNYYGYISGGGTVTVDGSGSQWNNALTVTVGAGGTGNLNIQNGGTVSTGSDGLIGTYGYQGSNGIVKVTGVGSQWNSSSRIIVGSVGTGSLSILNGGKVSDDSGMIGDVTQSIGTATVDGTGSQWNNSYRLYVGNDGTGTLNIQNGGKVTAASVLISNNSLINLNGTSGSRGALETAAVVGGGGGIIFNGGLLRATADSSNLLQNFAPGNGYNGNLQIQSGGAFIDSNGHDVTISTVLGGGGNLTKQGTGTLTLSGGNTYAGGTTLSGGIVKISIGGNIGFGAITFAGGVLETTHTMTLANDVVVNDADHGVLIDTGVLTLNGSISGSYALHKAGAGTLVLGGTNNTQIVVNNGTVQGNASNAASSVNLASSSSNFAFVQPTQATYSGVISGSGGVTVSAPNTNLTLSGTSTYTGATTVTSGKLVVDGSIASSSGVNLASGTELGGHGTVSTITGAGTVAPGNSPGILTAVSTDPSGALTYVFQFTKTGSPIYSNAAASGNDVLRLTGALPFTAPLTNSNLVTVDFTAVTPLAGQNYLGGFYTDSGNFFSDIQNGHFNYLGLGIGQTVTVSTVQDAANFTGGSANGYVTEFTINGPAPAPEPGRVILLVMGSASLLLRRKRAGQA